MSQVLTDIPSEKKTAPKFLDDPLISFIVPVYDLPEMVLKRCLMSLADQDYENLEVICVLDGENNKLKSIIQPFVDQFKFQLHEIEHAGACAARNYGFKQSKGEIVSFFNSDYIAKPGMVRYWVRKLMNNPDYGFLYGGYEWNSRSQPPYPSKSFNEYELTSANYIDCGFPVWRKYVVEWDKDCKSLQDWDFWIRVVKNKVKGLYLDNYLSYMAEPPRPKGLTDDSSNNWMDRITYVREKNGIEKRDLLVTSLGAKNHAVEIAKLLGGDFRDDTIYKPSDYKALYMVGFYIRPDEPGLNAHARILSHFKDRYPKVKRIVHFVGASIYWLRKFPYDSLKYLVGALNDSCDHILTETQQDHDDLLQYGIESEIVPIPSYNDNWSVKPLPKDFKVSLYLVEKGSGRGQSDFDKYCYEQTLSIVRAMPDVQFTGYGYGGTDVHYPNLDVKGLIPRDKWPDYVNDNSCLLRLVRHDTLPMAGCEFLMAGRDVISNYPMPYADMIDTSGKSKLNQWDIFGEGFNVYNWPETKTKIIQKIRQIKQTPSINNLGMLDDRSKAQIASDYYKELLKKEVYIEKMKGFMQ